MGLVLLLVQRTRELMSECSKEFQTLSEEFLISETLTQPGDILSMTF